MQFRIKERYTADDRMFLIVEIIITFICMFIPLILFLVDGKARSSISAYVDMDNSYIYGLLFGVAGMTFLLNGALYFKVENDEERMPELKSLSALSESVYNKKRMGKWYNLVFGISLFGIAIFHYDKPETQYIHLIFALIFFVGSALVIFFIHDPEDKWKSRILAVISIAVLGIAFFTNGKTISLFLAETIALIIIAIHYILESYRICLDF